MKNNHQHTKRKSVATSSGQAPGANNKPLVLKLIIGWFIGALIGVLLAGLYILFDVFFVRNSTEKVDSTFEPAIETDVLPDFPNKSQEAEFPNPLPEQPAEPTSAPIQTASSAAPSNGLPRAYEEGYEKGFDDGESDSNLHYGWHTSYDDDCSYTGKMRADYIEGYDDGYGDGYDSGIEGDDTEESLELEW